MADQPEFVFRDLTARTRWLAGGEVAFIFASALGVFGALRLVNFVEQVRTGNLTDRTQVLQIGQSVDGLNSVVAVVLLASLLVSLIAFLMWVYRANGNSHAMGASGIRSQGWSVGSYFIPFAYIIWGYDVMSEIWRASVNAPGWKALRAPALLMVWWLSFLFANVASGVGGLLLNEKTLATIETGAVFLAGEYVLNIVAAIALIVVVSKVRRQQLAQQAAPVIPS
ncbi:MAG TPA: DUF4328 domain-containing protein [Rhizomicrobium sp.]|nr:DUF4328 domain-containing protein [Rhizomicrobium sp.]